MAGFTGRRSMARAGETQAAQLPFENAKALVFRGLHSLHVRVRRGLNCAKLDQQIPQVPLEARRPGPGEDFTHNGRRGDDRARLATCGREFARTALCFCSSSGHGVPGYQGITHQSSLARWLAG